MPRAEPLQSPVQIRRAKARLMRSVAAEYDYTRRLLLIARQVSDIVKATAGDPAQTVSMLQSFSRALVPWARAVAGRMLAEVLRKDEAAWKALSRHMSRALSQEIRSAPVHKALQELQARQVVMITSLPYLAAQRVQKLALMAVEQGHRSEVLKAQIMRTGLVTENRARLIARTEIGKARANIAEVRGKHIGSEGYIWRTAHDSDVRPSHRAMEGKFVCWEKPPTLDGMIGHAGALPECRCWMEVVVPDE